ncbi:MAG TPA: hypothetical protein VLN45_11505, partial [Ignavibacteriaceae bacterium]|nr:hypothetical protein [Ignavibacteriaceae bacterium]
DLSVKDVEIINENYEIEVEKKGLLPAHFNLLIKYSDGSNELKEFNVSLWRNGDKIYKMILPTDKVIEEVEIIDESLRDADLSNNKFSIN